MTDLTPYIRLWFYFFGISTLISLLIHIKLKTKTSKLILLIIGSILIVSVVVMIVFILIYIIQLLRNPAEL